ncbi:MAG TPA: TetR/AcrR family transcriptional regulator [Spirochaetota bacterium]|nr:TetR/AcrR family transcriptional regulator [Spirochaetota bacterium]HPV40746.1 TetR/AcrR family transcriptional regulator [Spirochaetota bacterium]
MKRKNNPPKEDVKKEIIIKSREIISKMGYKKSSTEEIARSLNKTKGALYHYFENREEIIKEVLKYEGQLVKEAVSEALVKEKEPDKQLHSFFLIRARQVYELWSFYQSVIAEYFNRYSFIMSTLSEYTSEEQSILEGILRDGNRKKVFNVKNVRLTSSALIKAMRGYDFFMFQGVRFEDIEDEISETLRVLIRGLG